MKHSGMLIGIVVLIMLVTLGNRDIEEAIQQQNLYCEMVTTYNETGGEYGWPDYNGNYDKMCK